MADDRTTIENTTPIGADAPPETPSGAARRGKAGGGRGRAGGRGSGRRVRRERTKPEFDQHIISIRRVTRVVAGGRRFSFSVAIVIGNRKGRVGVGIGKAPDTAAAIDKAVRDAKKHSIDVVRTKTHSIPHDVFAKYSSAQVLLYPAPGRGLTAGSSVRTVLELGGVADIGGKVFSRSKNKLNIARATIVALSRLTNSRQPTTNNRRTKATASDTASL